MRRRLQNMVFGTIGVLLCASVGAALARRSPAAPPPASCPRLRIVVPDGAQLADATWTFLVDVAGADAQATLSYSWAVDQGTIQSGQGTPAIPIAQPDLQRGIEVGVDVGGLPAGCARNTAVAMIS